jgi:hypothetical protein
MTDTWRSAGLSAQDITVDFGAAQSVDLIGILNHNLTTFATIEIAAGTSTAYANYSTTITWREFDAFTRLSSAQSYRYWRIRITDTSNPDGFIEVGYVLLGSLVQPGFTFRYDWDLNTDIRSAEVTTEFDTPYVEAIFTIRKMNLDFGPLTDANMEIVRTLHRRTKRNIYPVFILPSRSGSDGFFMKLDDDINEEIRIRRYCTISLTEDSRGCRLSA